MYLGIRCVIAKSFARIHAANLINAGILPLTFRDPKDYDQVQQGAVLTLTDLAKGMERGEINAIDETTGTEFRLLGSFTKRQREILLAGGLLNFTKECGQ